MSDSLLRARCEECAKPLSENERKRGETFCTECCSVPEAERSTPSETSGLCIVDPGSDV